MSVGQAQPFGVSVEGCAMKSRQVVRRLICQLAFLRRAHDHRSETFADAEILTVMEITTGSPVRRLPTFIGPVVVEKA